jgi:hypothetical protein
LIVCADEIIWVSISTQAVKLVILEPSRKVGNEHTQIDRLDWDEISGWLSSTLAASLYPKPRFDSMDYLHSCNEGCWVLCLIIVDSLLDVLRYRFIVHSESRKSEELKAFVSSAI